MTRRVLVTGASQGIGRATAIMLAKEGFILLRITAQALKAPKTHSNKSSIMVVLNYYSLISRTERNAMKYSLKT